MVEPSGMISGFKVTNYYKYILYVAGAILILSFFVQAPEGMNNFKIRNTAFWIIVGGLLIWFIHDLIRLIPDDWWDEIDYFIVFVYYGSQALIWFLVFDRVISPNL